MDTPDEIRENRFRENNPELFIEPKTELCDCCLCQKEETRLSPDGGGFTCVDCIGRTYESSYAVKRFSSITCHTEQELKDWFNKLKII